MEIPRLSKEELSMLTERNVARSLVGVFRVYGSIVLIIGIAILLFDTYGWWWALGIAFPLVGALQHGISILLHETVHSLFSSSKKVNELVGNVLFGYPIGFSLDYRKVHFAHHAHLGTGEDPDMVNYRDFPGARKVLLKKLFLDFSGVGAVVQFVGIGRAANDASVLAQKGHLYHVVGIVLTQLAILGIFSLFGYPLMYFILWLFPLVTVAKGLAQLRNLAEHLALHEEGVGTERTRTFESTLLERFCIGPLNFNYHAEHHLYPMIPYYNLPKAYAILKRHPAYATYVQISPSYWKTITKAVQ